jgi:hypothetical protein
VTVTVVEKDGQNTDAEGSNFPSIIRLGELNSKNLPAWRISWEILDHTWKLKAMTIARGFSGQR